MPGSRRKPFSYAVVRVVPRIDRGERINAGVIVHCRQLCFLAARIGLDEARLRALAPSLKPADVRAQLETIVKVADGDPHAGPVAALPPWERFDWLVAPSSTIIQVSQPHTGLTGDPRATLAALYRELVEPPA
jgi:hypothetical protein